MLMVVFKEPFYTYILLYFPSFPPARNGASCNNQGGHYTCDCLPGFQGAQCQFDVDDCANGPCHNGGTCHDQINSFYCSCPHGTEGLLCEVNKDDCFEGACHHDGTCVDEINRFSCRYVES